MLLTSPTDTKREMEMRRYLFAVHISAACTFGTGWAQGWLRAASQLVWLVGGHGICSPEVSGAALGGGGM